MATYFDGTSNSEIQAGGDGLQTLILMNPTGYLGFSDQPPQNNLVFLNSDTPGSSSFNALQPTHESQPPQHLVGIPLATPATSSHSHSHSQSQHDISLLHAFLPRVQYNVYNSQKVVACETPRAQQGLSLSLSSQLPPHNVSVSTTGGGGACYSSSSVISNGGGGGGMQNVMLSSKYLKAAQELLDEVVNVGKGVKSGGSDKKDIGVDQESLSEIAAAAAGGEGGNGWENGGKHGGDLNTAERQDIQMKKSKLVSMLDEVEQRYRQYHHQMQTVTSMFEQAGGIGSAKAYTALALQTISKQFRSLKDAILSQLQVASKSLGEEVEESLGGKMKMNGSRMKYVDNQLRQQRALQQLGMVQHNAWRPQRGLPERSVSVLRAWLFEHFLHPYPKDSDKIMLAKQTGLTRSQVSNWFINARVRLWKPMVEEMYTEEIKEQEKNGSEEKSGKSEQYEDAAATKTTPPVKTSTLENQNKGSYVLNQNITSPMSSTSQARTNIDESPKKHVSVSTDTRLGGDSDNEHMSMNIDTERQTRDGFSLLGGGFSAYPPPIAELGRFNADQQFPTSYSGNGVSLTLGLPHCDNLGPHQTFLPNQNNIELARGGGVDIGEAHDIDYGNIEHRITLPEYMRESTFRATRGLLHDYYHTL